jgi:hypothetical protein
MIFLQLNILTIVETLLIIRKNAIVTGLLDRQAADSNLLNSAHHKAEQ